MTQTHKKKEHRESEHPFLLMEFWRWALLSILMVVLFPWSLLFCLFFYGVNGTIFLCSALLHDAMKVIFVFLIVIAVIAIFTAIMSPLTQ